MKPTIGAIALVSTAMLAAACGREDEPKPGESTTTAATVTASRESATVAPPASPPPTPSPANRVQALAPPRGAPTNPGPNNNASPSTPQAAPGAPAPAAAGGPIDLGVPSPKGHPDDLVDRGPLVPKGLNPPPPVGSGPLHLERQ